MVTDDAGKVLLMVRFLQAADVPALMVGMLLIPLALVMVTSVVLVGTERPHQLLAVPQSLLVPPSHPPVERTVILTAAVVLLHPPEEVTFSLYQVVWVSAGVT